MFQNMANPFVYEEPVDPSELVDRSAELARLRQRAAEARNSRVEGPRRFGKTSVLRATLAAADRDGAIAIDVNFLGCTTAADVTERIERAYRAQLDSALRRWFDGVVRTFRPTVVAAPGGVGMSATPRASTPGLLDRLGMPRGIHEQTGRQCVIAFDEFQEVVRIDPTLPGVIRSELETHGRAAAYIFSGSHPGLMRDLFSDRRHAFFAQAAPVELGPLPPDELADYISDRFVAAGRDPGEGLGPLLDVAEGHPQRAMLLAHHLYEHTAMGERAGIVTWVDALAAAQREALGEIQVLWERCTGLERRALKVISQRTVPLTGREAAQRFGLPRSGSTRATVERLARDGHVVRDSSVRAGWRVLDPFLAEWLRTSGASDA
jgi:hypothetical protein